MQLSDLDSRDLFSLTWWKNAEGFCVGVQRLAGDQVHYENRKVLSEAIIAAVEAVTPKPIPAPAIVPPPPF
ncbi:hypothetical protein AOQ73_05640 [Bradyrhizobium pachyrhizi]|uniref:hypothetical protein n=1 Tax=Bradyrhizobium pachyrhizi TaxID=280333 RepID=UPI000705511B|nr:hypothetical protein [Bradyrhizobium pachyrhizi]KRQ11889.1 hypothetical protein AOQ73_05640 [Bradyrhizobium pachyrhizi]